MADGKKDFEEKLERSLREQYNRGVMVGSSSIAKLVLSKLNDKSRTFPQRIADVQKVCRLSIKAVETLGETKK